MYRCRDKPDIEVGSIYGHLKILSVNKNNKTCVCECSCSKQVTLSIKDVKNKRKTTCGCRTRRNRPLKKGMIVREVRIIEQATDEVYKTGKKKRWVVECVNCKSRRVIRETDLATQRIGICPVCKNAKEVNTNEKEILKSDVSDAPNGDSVFSSN